MSDFYTFSLRRLETYDEELHPYILGILKWHISEYITPPSLKYFKKPEKSDYPLILESENHKYEVQYNNFTVKSEILPVFLCKENVKSQLKLKQLNKISIWSNRGTLAMILMGAFQRYDWRMFATKVGSNIYLKCDKDSGYSVGQFHHWKFIQNCFTDSVGDKPNPNLPIDEDDQFCCLFHAEIGDFDLIYTGQVSGVLADSDVKNMHDINELNQLNFVLTKTMYEQSSKRWLYHYKLWWTQAYLAKANDIFVGIKESEENGPVLVRQDIRHFTVDQIWQKTHKKRQRGELLLFLKCLQTKMSDIDCPYTTCELNFDSDSKNVTFKVHDGKTEHTFLSPELIEYFKTN